MLRRDALKLAALSAAGFALPGGARAATHHEPIIDSHIHLFDPTRPGGVPWPEKSDTALYKPATPERYQALSAAYGVVGAIAIEASPLASDNQWLLDIAAHHPFIVGVIGDLVPSSPAYLHDLDRLRAEPLFLGFRYGNIWDRDLSVDLEKPEFIDGLKALAQASLVFESANPDPKLIRAILTVSDRVPGLRIVIDHLPHAPVPTEKAARDEYWANLHRLAANPGVYVKLSEIPVVVNNELVTDPEPYKAPLDAIWDVFGDDHLVFGSDWPNSDHVAPYADTMSIVRASMAGKNSTTREKYFWKNSGAVYKWHRRKPDQPVL